MNSIPNYFSISGNNIRRWFTNPRIYILIALLLILMWTYLGPILFFSKGIGYRVAPWVFPFISNFSYTQRFMMLGIVFLFCDAPFVNEGQPYLLIRSGRTHWALGQILYIMLATAIYFLFLAVISILMLTPNLFLSTDWGKLLGTLAQTSVGQDFNVHLPISYKIQTMYTPVQAFSLSLLLDWCAGTLLGLTIFITNIYLNRAIGAILASAIILLDVAVYNNFTDYAYHFSPVSMARLAVLDPSGMSLRPTFLYACIFFMAAIIVLSIIAVLSVHKREIEISPQI
ncbi:hypothetical protein [Paenibacillus zanthoxyli]|uniref:hypothetical protein n=1 Tax=Paenibacillus zanthoxyli TaxID=369399 RepID=UPI000470376D|nr:hypothetical protein [Paenibacillus zanthoxyli]